MDKFTVVYVNSYFVGRGVNHCVQVEHIEVSPFDTLEHILALKRIKDLRYLFIGHPKIIEQNIGLLV
jgi:hypothetical protein